jgi:hypothetical protein
MKDDVLEGVKIPSYVEGMGRYAKEYAMAEKIYHEEWYNGPAKRPPSSLYRNNFDRIKWSNKCPVKPTNF